MSTTTCPSSISFKVRYGTDLRRFRLPTATLTYPVLLQTLMTAFHVDHKVRVTYKDEEGDEVLIGSTRELQAALIPPPPLLHLTLTTHDQLEESMILVEHVHTQVVSPTPSTLEVATQDVVQEMDWNGDEKLVPSTSQSVDQTTPASTLASTPTPTPAPTSTPTPTPTPNPTLPPTSTPTLPTTVATSSPIPVSTSTSIPISSHDHVNDEKHGIPMNVSQDQHIEKPLADRAEVSSIPPAQHETVMPPSPSPSPPSSPQQTQTLVPASFDLTQSSSWTSSPSEIVSLTPQSLLDGVEPSPPQPMQLPVIDDISVPFTPTISTSSSSTPISSPTVSLPIPIASPTSVVPVTGPTTTFPPSSFSWLADKVRGLFSHDSKIPDLHSSSKLREHFRLKMQMVALFQQSGVSSLSSSSSCYYFNGMDIVKLDEIPPGSSHNYFDASEIDIRANHIVIYYPSTEQHINMLYGEKGFAYAVIHNTPWTQKATRSTMITQFPDPVMEYYYQHPIEMFNQFKSHVLSSTEPVTATLPEPIVVSEPELEPVVPSSSSSSSIPISPDDPEEAAIQAALERSQYLNDDEKQQHLDAKEESMSIREFIEQDGISSIVQQILNQLTMAMTPDVAQLIHASQNEIHTDITPFTIKPSDFTLTRDALLADVSRMIKHHREQYQMIQQQQEQARVEAEMKAQVEHEAQRVQEAELAGIAAAAAAQAFAQEAEAKRVAQQQQAPIIDVLPETPEQIARRVEEEICVRLLALEQMGFSNTVLNRRLLRQNNNNLGDCIEWLLTNNAVELGPISPSNNVGPM